jgi:hypothetical protein
MTTKAPIKIVKRALWRPGWHQLDQPLGIGQFSRFAFFTPAHSSLGSPRPAPSGKASAPSGKASAPASKASDPASIAPAKQAEREGASWNEEADLNQEVGGGPLDFQFFNRTISETHQPLFRFARVLEILHPVLGPLERVDTSGLDYVFKPVGSDEIFVNAEEEPGVAYDFDQPISDWSLLVTLDDVSEPQADAIV